MFSNQIITNVVVCGLNSCSPKYRSVYEAGPRKRLAGLNLRTACSENSSHQSKCHQLMKSTADETENLSPAGPEISLGSPLRGLVQPAAGSRPPHFIAVPDRARSNCPTPRIYCVSCLLLENRRFRLESRVETAAANFLPCKCREPFHHEFAIAKRSRTT